MHLFWYTFVMPRKPKPLEPLDLAVIAILVGCQEDAGLSQRRLARATGMSLNRVGIILRAEGPAPTVGELDALAGALGVQGSEVLRRAEGQVAGRPAPRARAEADSQTGTRAGTQADSDTRALSDP